MDISLALLRHRLAAQRGAWDDPPDDPQRPDGPLLRLHLCPGARHGGTLRLIDDLRALRPDVTLAASGELERIPDGAIHVATPRETPEAVRAHLDHWRPDTLIFSGPDPFPILWSEAQRRAIPMVALEADTRASALALVRPLERFDFVHAQAADPRLTFRDGSVAPLARTAPPPSVIDSDLEDLSALLTTRPVWLSTETPEAEFDLVLNAHIDAAKLSHRLLLVLELVDPHNIVAAQNILQNKGLRSVIRSEGEEPSLDTQVLIADEPGEIGLWARLAPICYLAGSFTDGASCDPLVPASLGSVIVHGPMGGQHQDILDTLDSTHGANRVKKPSALGEAIEALLSPERGAQIAHEAWDVATRGAEASNRALQAMERALPPRTGS